MRTMPSKDLRVTKTLEAIDTNFRSMMLEEGFEAITVKALCERARINKKTFYRYYETLDDLLAEVMATYAAAWRKRTGHLRMPDDIEEVARELFRFGAEQDPLYDAITCDPVFDRVQAELQDDASGEHAESIPRGWTSERWHVFYAWQSAALLAMYRAWVADNKTLPVEEVAEMAATLVCHGAEGMPRR
jgi:AcrR family transcriptional regulator